MWTFVSFVVSAVLFHRQDYFRRARDRANGAVDGDRVISGSSSRMTRADASATASAPATAASAAGDQRAEQCAEDGKPYPHVFLPSARSTITCRLPLSVTCRVESTFLSSGGSKWEIFAYGREAEVQYTTEVDLTGRSVAVSSGLGWSRARSLRFLVSSFRKPETENLKLAE